MFACETGETVIPDFIALAKGLTAGYMPLATPHSQRKEYSQKHSWEHTRSKKLSITAIAIPANQLGCVAALASLEIFREETVLDGLQKKSRCCQNSSRLAEIASSPCRGYPRCRGKQVCGFIAGIDIADAVGNPYDVNLQMGARVCMAARKHGLLTRPIRDTIVTCCRLTVSRRVTIRTASRDGGDLSRGNRRNLLGACALLTLSQISPQMLRRFGRGKEGSGAIPTYRRPGISAVTRSMIFSFSSGSRLQVL